MTDIVESRFDAVNGETHPMLTPGLDELAAHIQALRDEVAEAMHVARAASVHSEQVQSDYLRALGSASLDERLANFETFLVHKVKSEMQAHPPQLADGAAGGALIITTSTDEATQRDRATRQAQVHQRITSEALRAKTTALEQRQSTLEGKLNALVSDFVLTNQSNQSEMKAFGNTLRLQLRRHREDVRQQLASASPSADGGTSPLVETRMGEVVKVMALLDARTQETQSNLDAAEAQWFTLMSRLVEKVSELTVQVGQLEEAHQPQPRALTASLGETDSPGIADPVLQVHLRVVEDAMCHFADDLERLRDEVHHSHKQLNGRDVVVLSGGVPAKAAAQLLAAQQQRLVRAHFFQTWKRVAEEKTRRERDEMFLTVLRAHQEEIHRLKERVAVNTEPTKKLPVASKRENAALVKELQKCIRVAVADKSNPPSVHVCRALQAIGNWAEQTEHSARAGAA